MGCGWREGTDNALAHSAGAFINTFRCPSDRFESSAWPQCNYGLSLGPNMGWDDPINGWFQWGHETAFADVTDGTSNTIMLAEIRTPSNNGNSTALSDSIDKVAVVGGLAPNTSFPDSLPAGANLAAQVAALQGAINQWGAAALANLQTHTNQYSGCCYAGWLSDNNQVTELAPPNWQYPDTTYDGCGFRMAHGAFASRSLHPGGVNVAMGDGSVRFASSTVNYGTWMAMGARNDGVPVTLP